VNFAIKSSYIKSLLPNLPDAFIRDKGIVVVPVEEIGFKERVKNDIVLVEAVPEFKPTVVKRDYEDEGRLREEREIAERERELLEREQQIEAEERLRRERDIAERERRLQAREMELKQKEQFNVHSSDDFLRKRREAAEAERRHWESLMGNNNRKPQPRRKAPCWEVGVCNRPMPSGSGDSLYQNKKKPKWNFDFNLNFGK
jgi:hypothetical protein